MMQVTYRRPWNTKTKKKSLPEFLELMTYETFCYYLLIYKLLHKYITILALLI